MKQLDRTFSALGDATRRAILMRLADGETALSAVAEPFGMSQTAVSKHIKVLSDAGLVSVTKRGRTRYCRLQAAPMQDAAVWLTQYQQFWSKQFDALKMHLEEKS